MKRYAALMGVLILTALIFYWVDTIRIQRTVQRSVADSLNQSLQSEIALQPTELAAELPAKDSSNLYITVHDANKSDSYRVLNVEDYWVQRQIETAARTSFDQDTSDPVAKIIGFSIQYVPAINSAVAHANVQYADLFGIVRSIRVNVANVPLKHLPVN